MLWLLVSRRKCEEIMQLEIFIEVIIVLDRKPLQIRVCPFVICLRCDFFCWSFYLSLSKVVSFYRPK